ncbi:MAG: polyphosphate kinase 2 [Bacteroidetes bacterium]|nr:polyphosphate kinase 2 [Bacteroidota bacterium]
MSELVFTNQEIERLKTKEELEAYLLEEHVNLDNIKAKIQYEVELAHLQFELQKLQKWINKNKKRVVIIFEGRDAAGKGGSIRRFKRFLNPRSARVVALAKPSEIEQGQWYFRRHMKELPNPGEIVFFDRSWYNRAVVEPVMGFCKPEEYNLFMQQVTEFEHMLYEDGVQFIKLWFSITKKEQTKRFESRMTNPLKQWKISPVDLESRELWEEYSHHIRQMFVRTHTNFSPWIIIKTDYKRVARLESIRHVLSKFDYDGKDIDDSSLYPDPNVVHRFYRSLFDDIYIKENLKR